MAIKNLQNNNDLSELLVSVRRVTTVTKGGRRFSFSILVVVGDEKGRVVYYSICQARGIG